MAGDELTIIPPTAPLRGHAAPPGSKSITNRAILLAGLSKGTSRLTGALMSDDTRYMADALRAMGVLIGQPDDTTFVIEGSGVLQEPAAPLFLGNAGTATRFLTAAAALIDGTVIVDGDQHMRKRPIKPLIDAMVSMGIDATAPTGCPPVTVRGTGGFDASRILIDGSLSSQYISALLMMAACGRRPVDVELTGEHIGALGYIDLTTAAMKSFGAEVERVSPTIWHVEPTGYRAIDFAIEPDASASTYLWAAEVLTGGEIDIGMPAHSFSQPDAQSYDLISLFPHLPAVIDGSQMQDAVPTLAVLAAFNATPVRFTGIANLRVKECDRIRALSTGLNAIRPDLAREIGDDLLVASDPALAGQFLPARIDTFSDHRIAMSFALAGLKMKGITILEPDCVAKTFPAYWEMLASLGVRYQA